jgi:hypothetical protein
VITLAVYAVVVTVLLIVAVCFLIVLVRERKEIVRRATEASTAKLAAIDAYVKAERAKRNIAT